MRQNAVFSTFVLSFLLLFLGKYNWNTQPITLPAVPGKVSGVTSDPWSSLPIDGALAARGFHSAVWTGSEMIVWGGEGSYVYGNGASYHPDSNSWTPISSSGAPVLRIRHTAVWTGSEMIIWGGENEDGYRGDGARYAPVTNTWTPLPASGAPSASSCHTAVWTGGASSAGEMIVWGGMGVGGMFDDGARYNPGTNAWEKISASGAPSARCDPTSVWTGSEMIIWGGENSSGYLGDGARYNPTTDSWTPITTSGAPSGRIGYTALWTGGNGASGEMLIWGGWNSSSGILEDGARYNPATDTWTPISSSGAPSARSDYAAAWTGNEMIIWGGNGSASSHGAPLGDGSVYNPVTDHWTPIPSNNFPAPRYWHTAVWIGNDFDASSGNVVGEMLIWGGFANGSYRNDGARFKLVRNQYYLPVMLVTP